MEINIYKGFETKKSLSLETFYSLFEMTYPKDYSYSGEMHDSWELVYVREGDVCVSADEHIFYLSEGEVIFHKPLEFHKFHVENEKSATLFITCFNVSGTLMNHFANCVLRLSPEQKKHISRIISYLHEECCMGNVNDFTCLNELQRCPSKFQTFLCKMELWLLSLSENGVAINAAMTTPETIAYQKAVQVMEKRIHEWLSVPQIAAECHVSVSYLKSVFRKYTGIGIHQYFIKHKITHASSMLREGISVAEVANTLAFSSPSYFSTVYKRETGISPFVYKINNEGELK